MKDNRVFEALTDIDDDLIKEAKLPETENRKVIAPKRKLLVALAAAVLTAALIFAALAIGGAFTKNEENKPPVDIPEGETDAQSESEPTIDAPSAGASTENGSGTTIGPNIELPDRFNVGSPVEPGALYVEGGDRLSYEWLLLFRSGDDIVCMPGENRGILRLANGAATRFTSEEQRAWPQYETIMGLARDGDCIYFPGGLRYGDSTTHGIYRMNVLTGETETYITTNEKVSAVRIIDGTLYYLTSRQSYTYAEDGVTMISLFGTQIMAADMNAQTLKYLARFDDTDSAAFYGVSDGKLVLNFPTKDELRFVNIETGEVTSVPFAADGMKFFIDGKLYVCGVHPEEAGGKKSIDVYNLSGELLYTYENEEGFTFFHLCGFGLTAYNGRFAAMRDGTLYLVDLKTGNAEKIADGLCGSESYGGCPCSFAVFEGRLWFVDYTDGKLHVFDGSEEIGTYELHFDYLNQGN